MPEHDIEPTRVRAAAFDMGGVILAGGPSDVLAFGERVGIPESEWLGIRDEVFGDDGPWAEIERGEITFEKFCRHLISAIVARGGRVDMDLAGQFMGERGEQTQIERIRVEVCAAIKAIRRRMPTALLTNNIVEWRPTWSRILDVEGMFDVIVDSSELGMRKPEPRIYDHTREQLGVAHDEMFFVDDLRRNLKTARALGWQTLHYDDTDRVLGVLKELAGGESLRAPADASRT